MPRHCPRHCRRPRRPHRRRHPPCQWQQLGLPCRCGESAGSNITNSFGNSLLCYKFWNRQTKRTDQFPLLPLPIFARLSRQVTCWSDPCVSCACDVLPRQPGDVIVVINPSSITCTPSTAPKKGASQTKGPLPVALSGASLCKLPMLKQGWICSTFKCRHPTMLAHTIHGLKKPVENCLAEVSFNQLHPCDTPEKRISSDTLHLFSMFEWVDVLNWIWNPKFLEISRISSTSSWSPILLCRKIVSLFHPKNDFSKKTKRWSYLQGASITVQMDQKNAKTQELMETWVNQLNQHLLKALSWYTSANVMHLEYSYSCINLSKKTPLFSDTWKYLLFQKFSDHLLANPHFQINAKSLRQISQNCHTWHSLIQKKRWFTSNPCKKNWPKKAGKKKNMEAWALPSPGEAEQCSMNHKLNLMMEIRLFFSKIINPINPINPRYFIYMYIYINIGLGYSWLH